MSESLTAEATESNEDLQGVDQSTTEAVSDDNNGPAIERPEWLLDKYATGERSQDEAIIEQAKAYKEAEKRLVAFVRA